ncbi:cobalamin-binding protein [Rhodohalobacter sp. 614A]|uniref:cobalamin-binding protein n=1 Tax=Rhodohalobacter sp. 614A TaxID=2908649 RepID=UPI001F1BD18D|nr:cobalamin-binding protein [Rhodohalobacter sp. 614A]
MKIVSLLPSATEIICELGLEDQLVGRSHECNTIPSIRELPVVTDSSVKNTGNSLQIDKNIKSILKSGLSIFNVNVNVLAELDPDIIFTQDHCEVCAVSLDDVQRAVNEYCGGRAKVISLSPVNLSEIFETFYTVGKALDVPKKAEELVEKLKSRLDIIRSTVIGESVKKVACIEWIEPLMTGGNWIPELLEIAGGEYLLSEPGKHSPWIEWDDILKEDPDVILIMPCGYPIEQTMKEIHLLTQKTKWADLKAVQNGEVYILDGNRYFNRPGPGVYESTRILGEVLHPKLFKPVYHKDGWIHLSEQLEKA